MTSALAAWDSDWEIYDPLAAAHDIVGYNYMMHKGPSDHERVPSRIMMQTESYPRDAFANWARVNDHSYIIGDFVWTAIDYLGESDASSIKERPKANTTNVTNSRGTVPIAVTSTLLDGVNPYPTTARCSSSPNATNCSSP